MYKHFADRAEVSGSVAPRLRQKNPTRAGRAATLVTFRTSRKFKQALLRTTRRRPARLVKPRPPDPSRSHATRAADLTRPRGLRVRRAARAVSRRSDRRPPRCASGSSRRSRIPSRRHRCDRPLGRPAAASPRGSRLRQVARSRNLGAYPIASLTKVMTVLCCSARPPTVTGAPRRNRDDDGSAFVDARTARG